MAEPKVPPVTPIVITYSGNVRITTDQPGVTIKKK